MDDIALKTEMNLSQAYLKERNWGKAILHADAALKIESENVKALFRKATAQYEWQNYEAAAETLNTYQK